MPKLKGYILIALVILVGGGWYLHASKAKVPGISATLNLISDKKQEPVPEDKPIEFKNYGPAPEFSGIKKWINSDPQTIASLKGKVVIVDFWTYSSINSTRTIPYLTKWQNDYKDKGLQVVSIHTPEYTFEKIQDNLLNAIKTHSVNYPVGLDDDYKTWTAYHNQFWPALYLVDRDGNIIYTYYGEGNYADIEKALRTVLGVEGNYTTPPLVEQDQSKTPEIYLGIAKQGKFGNADKPSGGEQIYTYPKKLSDNAFALEGKWQFNQEAAIHTNGFARLKLNFDAAKVFLVAESKTPTTIKVYVDGVLVKGVVVSNNDLYQLYDSIAGGKHTLEIEIPGGGFQAFTFTFG